MTDVLVVTEPGDYHAEVVGWALKQLGHSYRTWLPNRCEEEPLSCRISAHAPLSIQSGSPQATFPDGKVQSVWLRRTWQPNPSGALLPVDQVFAARELDYFVRGITWVSAPEALWANHPAAAHFASLKTPQLLAAQKAGLTVPETLCSNDLEAVRAFVRTAPGRVIYKTYRPACWDRSGTRYGVFTTFIEDKDLTDLNPVYFNAGIFQYFVPKAYELRVLIFGRTALAAKLSEEHELDWRITQQMKVSPYRLPEHIEAKLFQVMDALGLVMGMLDLIVTPEGDYVFLEVNQQGEFLWVEGMNPELRALDVCTQFLVSGDARFRLSPSDSPRVRYEDFLKSESYARYRQTKRHLAENGQQRSPFVLYE